MTHEQTGQPEPARRYRCATYEEAEALGYDETYSVLLRPDGTVLAALMEPEDRSWYRDGAEAVNELNEQAATIARLEAERAEALEGVKLQGYVVQRLGERIDEWKTAHDELGASAARMRLLVEKWDEQGHPKSCSAYWGEHECTCGDAERSAALSDPAPLEWLRQHDAEVVEPYRAMVERLLSCVPGSHQNDSLLRRRLGIPDTEFAVGCINAILEARALLAGRAGTEATNAEG